MEILWSSNHTISECGERYAEDDADGHIARKSHDIASLQHKHAFVGKGRECRKAAAHACREQ